MVIIPTVALIINTLSHLTDPLMLHHGLHVVMCLTFANKCLFIQEHQIPKEKETCYSWTNGIGVVEMEI